MVLSHSGTTSTIGKESATLSKVHTIRRFAMPRAKKTVKRVSKTVKANPSVDLSMTAMPEITPSTPRKMNSKFLSSALIVVGLALLAYKLGPWLVPAVVDNRPVTRFEVWSRMEKSYGAQTID